MKKTYLWGFFCLFALTAAGGEWPDYANRPDWIRRGTARISFSDPNPNSMQAGINFYRIHYLDLNLDKAQIQQTAELLEKLSKQGIGFIQYTSPTDCFWDGRLKNIIPRIADWKINVLEYSPELVKGLACGDNGEILIAYNNPNDRGGNAARKYGCRFSKAWNAYTMDMYNYLIHGKKAVAGNPAYKTWPDYSPLEKYIQGFYIDNAAPWRNCGCDECKADWKSYVKNTRSEKIADSVARSKYRAEVCYRYNKSITDLANKNQRYTMFGGQIGYMDTEVNSVLWERLYQHAPWGRLYPFYKIGLSAGRGQLSSGITYLVPPPGLEAHELPEITPQFTQMALAEGMANIGSYILFNETGNDFLPGVKKYNKFNEINPEIFNAAQKNGKAAVFFPILSIILGKDNQGRMLDYSLINRSVEELASRGVPVEVISEKDMDSDWINEFSTIIMRNLNCADANLIAKVADFYDKGGKILLTEDFGKYDDMGRRANNPAADRLLQLAKENAPRIRLLELDKLEARLGYPPDMKKQLKSYNEGYYFEKLNEVFDGKSPVCFVAPKGDWMINSQRHPQSGLESFHIVNYNYATNPVTLLSKPEEAIEFNFDADPKTNPENKFHFYGKCINGGTDIDIILNNNKVLSLSAAELNKIGEHEGYPVFKPRWYTINLPQTQIKTTNKLLIRPAEKSSTPGSLALYGKTIGNNTEHLGFYQVKTPSNMPLTSEIIPLTGGKIKIAERKGDWFAALITPDAKSEMLDIVKKDGFFEISVPSINIYSVIILGQNRDQLEKIVSKQSCEN